MEQLGDELERLGWSKQEAACYHALVKFGSMKASQIADRIDSQPAKVYQPLNRLHDEGYVKIRDENPQIYMAQNPRFVIEKEQEQFEEKTDDVLAKLEEAWEIQFERGPDSDVPAQVLSGRDGMNTELQSVVEEAEDSILGFDTRLSWATAGVIESLENAASRGVDVVIVGTEHGKEWLDRLSDEGVPTQVTEDVDRSSYYIVDGEHVLLNIGRQEATISFEDENVAGIIRDDFQTHAYEGDIET